MLKRFKTCLLILFSRNYAVVTDRKCRIRGERDKIAEMLIRLNDLYLDHVAAESALAETKKIINHDQ